MITENEFGAVTCSSGKPCFRTSGEIKDYIARRNKRCGGRTFRYYRCSECGCWHLTTKTVCGDYLLEKHAKRYNRLEKKSTDRAIFEKYGLAV